MCSNVEEGLAMGLRLFAALGFEGLRIFSFRNCRGFKIGLRIAERHTPMIIDNTKYPARSKIV